MVHPSWESWHLVSHHQTCCLPHLKTPTGLLSMTKDAGGGGTTILCHQALTEPSALAAVIMPACPR